MTDLRTIPPAVAAWLAALVCTQSSEPSFWPPVVLTLAVVALVGVLVAVARGGRHQRLSAVLAAVVVSVAAATAVSVAVSAGATERRPSALVGPATDGGIVALAVDVVGPPIALSGAYGLVVVDVTVTGVEDGGARTGGLRAPAVLFASDPAGTIAAGARLVLDARVENGRAGDQRAFVLRAVGDPVVGTPEAPSDPAAAVRTGFSDLAAGFAGDGAALLPGLAVGDTSLVDDALDERMTAASLSHLTAVSGANCALVVGAVFGALALLGAPRWGRVVAALLALAGFVALVTPEPSVVRAAVMAAIVLLGIAVGRPSAGVPVLGIAVVGILVSDPWLSRSFGFALSAAATAGLLLLARPLGRALTRVLPAPVAVALALPLAAQLACQPIIVLIDPAVPVWGVPANMLAAPAAPIATVLGMIACLLLPVAPAVATGVAALAWLPAQWIAGVATAAAAAPDAGLPWPSGPPGVIAWAAVLVTIAVVVSARSLRLAHVAGTMLLLGALAYGTLVGGDRLGEVWSRPTDWSVAMCDVGQGDAVLVRSAGRTALIDTGPDGTGIEECLSDLGVGHIDLLVLTHFDLDHVGGVAAVTGRVREVLHQPVHDPADAALLRDLEARGARLVETTTGLSGTLGDLPWRALWPPPDESHYTGNDGSVVIEFGGAVDAIFLGDLGKDSELALLADGRVGNAYRIVKFAHHGSADQYPALYERIDARLALVSCGRDNDYGHPTRSALALLDAQGTTVARTDQGGTTLVAVRGDSLVTWAAGPRPDSG
ncbi:ComEC/Rec2 family competence protein [Labedella populi]|uniref:ComEC/Rec2 family competence protein n=1 Tax=Labedella populi TaxID=2498850 RepID=UPI00140D8867|nr:ComEC/Rec2 family competence protein [Labedella populi]